VRIGSSAGRSSSGPERGRQGLGRHRSIRTREGAERPSGQLRHSPAGTETTTGRSKRAQLSSVPVGRSLQGRLGRGRSSRAAAWAWSVWKKRVILDARRRVGKTCWRPYRPHLASRGTYKAAARSSDRGALQLPRPQPSTPGEVGSRRRSAWTLQTACTSEGRPSRQSASKVVARRLRGERVPTSRSPLCAEVLAAASTRLPPLPVHQATNEGCQREDPGSDVGSSLCWVRDGICALLTLQECARDRAGQQQTTADQPVRGPTDAPTSSSSPSRRRASLVCSLPSSRPASRRS
jgi:hypothetical protein